MKEIVEFLCKCGLVVVGFWKLFGLFNFVDGIYFKFVKVFGGENMVCDFIIFDFEYKLNFCGFDE